MAADLSFLFNLAPELLDALHRDYQRDPASVDPNWRAFFAGFEFGQSTLRSSHQPPVTSHGAAATSHQSPITAPKQEIAVLQLIDAYRHRGHLFTKTNPVRKRRQYLPTLELDNFGLSDADLDTVYHAGIDVGLGPVPLRQIRDLLHQTYCESIGAEFKYLDDPTMVRWWQQRMESTRNRPNFSREKKRAILEQLARAVLFERCLHTKFVGQKRFSLEGAESAIPALEAMLRTGAEHGCREFVIGMSHRGRLNVLTNVLGKPYEAVFAEFEGQGPEGELAIFDGDVKYHLGFSSDRTLASGRSMHLTLTPNPSHLEAVDPVVEGMVRAKQERQSDLDAITPVLIHGDAALAAQGVVYEVVQMAQLDGFRTGGTVHLVINNQLGFTTGFLDARSSIYCTDIGKVTRSPILHVNGDDVEAVVLAVELAMAFRQEFHRDVFIDLLCYRRHGHNEADEPRFTQPILYKIIEQHPNPFEIYKRRLDAEGSVLVAEANQIAETCAALLDDRYEAAKQQPRITTAALFHGAWQGLRLATEADFEQSPETGVAEAVLRPLGERMLTIPPTVRCFQKIRKLFDERFRTFQKGNAIDWAIAEWLAYASLLQQGVGVRISGQDVERGTFAHRHAVITIEDSVEEYVPLRHVAPTQGRFAIFNSLLSEYAGLGFEFGYASADPSQLVVWEAQFGDFANGAQIIIDQFLSCSETKWQRMNGMVLLLPHGYEGQGPEHSSARVERFLALCANQNMQVVNCTTPANLFHALRRQLARPFRKPLVVCTPKSGLRNPRWVSPLSDFTHGGFRELLDDTTVDPTCVTRVILCTGKIYYELVEQRAQAGRRDVAICRLEQLYPLPKAQCAELVQRYPHAEWVWVQEEPANMGAWPFLLRAWTASALRVVARKESSTPATGFHRQHQTQQQEILTQAFADAPVRVARPRRVK
ncbi:MAG: 2-oxoglutarate dehydrogenase E1 component [Deltaproteobacteria bacterium]|nr:2-oxoglutarate dehydrogenase E1 component [Deltaproteobacteria bacterium]